MSPRRKNRVRLLTSREAALFFSRNVRWFRDHYRLGAFRWADGSPIEPDRVDNTHPTHPRFFWSVETLTYCAESLLRYDKMTKDHYDLVMRRLVLFLPGVK